MFAAAGSPLFFEYAWEVWFLGFVAAVGKPGKRLGGAAAGRRACKNKISWRFSMGANPTQAIAISIFLIGFTVLAGGFAGGGIILDLLGVALLAVSAVFFLKCKPWEEQGN